MFCYQCQETAQGKGCTIKGICGKTDNLANLQDLLVSNLKEISKLTVRLRENGEEFPEVNKFIVKKQSSFCLPCSLWELKTFIWDQHFPHFCRSM